MLEFASIVILGILAQWVAWRLKLPAILPLILIGLLVGPISTLFTENGSKWIEPVWDGQKGFFPGENLYYFVSLAIGVILFEGGLTLKRSEVRTVGPVITKLITLGAVITFVGSGVAAHYIFNLSWKVSFLFASLVIVTGPTVIAPILRNIPLKKDISAVLKWEGILIDPIGALVAVLLFEFISLDEGQEYTKTALMEFGKILLFGTTFGFAFAHGLAFLMRKNLIPGYLLNVVSLSVVLLVFVESDIFAHESGLLAVVVMGLVMGNMNIPNIKQLAYFKESLSVLLISILFILLAANIELEEMLLVYNWKSAILFSLVVFVIRPLAVFFSTLGSNLRLNEKTFISWVAPRGIVAAGIASLFGTKLVMQGEAGAEYITPLVFMIVLGTVLLNATTARGVAKLLGVFLKRSDGIIIIGASSFSRLIANYLQNNGRHVILVDSNQENIEKAQRMGLNAEEGNIFAEEFANNLEFSDIGYLLALTSSKDVNEFAITRFRDQLGEQGTFRLITQEEMSNPTNLAPEALFSKTDDYINLSEVARDYPKINSLKLQSKASYIKHLKALNEEKNSIPLMVKDTTGELHILPSMNDEMDIQEGFELIYLGKPLELQA